MTVIASIRRTFQKLSLRALVPASVLVLSACQSMPGQSTPSASRDVPMKTSAASPMAVHHSKKVRVKLAMYYDQTGTKLLAAERVNPADLKDRIYSDYKGFPPIPSDENDPSCKAPPMFCQPNNKFDVPSDAAFVVYYAWKDQPTPPSNTSQGIVGEPVFIEDLAVPNPQRTTTDLRCAKSTGDMVCVFPKMCICYAGNCAGACCR